MNRRFRLLAGLMVLGFLAPLFAGEAQAAEPTVLTILESREDVSFHRVLTLVGKGFAPVKDVRLMIDGVSSLSGTAIVLKSRTLIVLTLPAGVQKGPYLVRIFYGKSLANLTTMDYPVTVGASDTWEVTGSDAVLLQGKAGIGTASPTADLHVTGVDGALFEGVFNSGTIPAEGFGTRMMWYPGKAAFRAGAVGASQWDDGGVGTYSTAMGFSTIASGSRSTALGTTTTASGFSSTSMGYFTTASGDVSIAAGLETTAQAYSSFVLGTFNVLAGDPDNFVLTDPVLVVGNGLSDAFRSNAFTLLRNGNLTIAGTLTQGSDARMKTDVAPLSGVLGKLAAMHGVSYRFKEGTPAPAGRQIGLLAQEVREAFPELVAEDSEGKLSVAYGNFAAVLLEAVKEQQGTIEGQRATIEAQRKDLDSLEKRLALLEARAVK